MGGEERSATAAAGGGRLVEAEVAEEAVARVPAVGLHRAYDARPLAVTDGDVTVLCKGAGRRVGWRIGRSVARVSRLHVVVRPPAVVWYTLPSVSSTPAIRRQFTRSHCGHAMPGLPGTGCGVAPAVRRLVAKKGHRNATEGKRVGLGEVVESAHRQRTPPLERARPRQVRVLLAYVARASSLIIDLDGKAMRVHCLAGGIASETSHT